MNIQARVLLYRDPKISDKWAAQCLEYDIAAQGDSLEEVMKRFERTLVGNIVLALRHNETPLATFSTAPRRYVDMWNKGLALQQSMAVNIPSDELPENMSQFPDRVPRGHAELRIAA